MNQIDCPSNDKNDDRPFSILGYLKTQSDAENRWSTAKFNTSLSDSVLKGRLFLEIAVCDPNAARFDGFPLKANPYSWFLFKREKKKKMIFRFQSVAPLTICATRSRMLKSDIQTSINICKSGQRFRVMREEILRLCHSFLNNFKVVQRKNKTNMHLFKTILPNLIWGFLFAQPCESISILVRKWLTKRWKLTWNWYKLRSSFEFVCLINRNPYLSLTFELCVKLTWYRWKYYLSFIYD